MYRPRSRTTATAAVLRPAPQAKTQLCHGCHDDLTCPCLRRVDSPPSPLTHCGSCELDKIPNLSRVRGRMHLLQVGYMYHELCGARQDSESLRGQGEDASVASGIHVSCTLGLQARLASLHAFSAPSACDDCKSSCPGRLLSSNATHLHCLAAQLRHTERACRAYWVSYLCQHVYIHAVRVHVRA